ncbi:MAG: RagB/SusD family nutrient uptake outer membrane protein, partial [Segetibacter sp.]
MKNNNNKSNYFAKLFLKSWNAIIAVFLLMIILGSCKKALVEESKSLSAETFYNTAAEVEGGVNAIYLPYRGFGFSDYISLNETFSDYLVGRNTFFADFQGLSTTNSNRTASLWNGFYLSIRNANLVINFAPQGKNISQADIDKYVGEAKFMRAFNYFQLVKNWDGVPLRVETNMLDVDLKRSTAKETYDLIIADLLDAEAKLPETAALAGRPSKYAAKTLLADVYLQTGNYTGARDKAGDVISSNKYALVPVKTVDDFQKIFGPDVVTTSEEIFYTKATRQNGLGNGFVMHVNHSSNKFHGAGGFFILYSWSTTPYYTGWDDNDKRKELWYAIDMGLVGNTVMNKKFIDPLAPSSSGAGNDIPWYRYADLLMIYAEAVARVGGPTAEAMEALNQVHRRGYGYDSKTPSPVDFKLADYNAFSFLDLVVKEYGYEFQLEGKRWSELKRTGKASEIILAM